MSESGLVRWSVKAAPPEGAAHVVINITNGGNKSLMYNFSAAVKQKGGSPSLAASGAASPAQPSPSDRRSEVAASAAKLSERRRPRGMAIDESK